MGFRVESYSLSEIHRIAVPGAVAPSLFWALPVGDWRPGELDEVWRWFTEHLGECYDFGLLLVKEMGRREGEAVNLSLTSVGAKLCDLMPAGAERFARSSAYRGESPRVLVLSGATLSPDGGVLVEWRRDIRRFEDLIGRTTRQMRDEDSTNELNAFKEAAQTFHRWRDLRGPPAKSNVSTMEGEILAAQKVQNFLREAQTALKAGEYRLVGERLIAAVQETGQAAWLNIREGSLQTLLDAQRTLLTAASVSAVLSEVLATEIEPKLQALLADPSKREAAFRNLPSDEAKHALKACRIVRASLRRQVAFRLGQNRFWLSGQLRLKRASLS